MSSAYTLAKEALASQALAIFHKETLVSTNTWAKEHFPQQNVKEALYLADEQTGGKGRDGRSWQQSQRGHCLLSTWSFTVPRPMQPILSPLVGWAVYKSLKDQWPQAPFALKAPNDIYLGDKKLAGLLIEMQTGAESPNQEVFVGLGLNLWSSPKTDQPTAALTDALPQWEDHFPSFLISLFENLKATLVSGQQTELSLESRNQIQMALSQNSKFAVDEVLANGSLVINQKTTAWWDL